MGGRIVPEVKKRHNNHVIETKSLIIVQNLLPAYWVIREYKPDYGIDLSVELFEKIGNDMYATLGEHIYIQLKGTEHLNVGTYKIYERNNVEMRPLQKGKISKEENVVKFTLDVSELMTVEKMGSAVPVLLFVVDVKEKCIYYICLNDYIEKVIIPEDPNYMAKDDKVIQIPCSNKIVNETDLWPLLWYGKRAKLFALANKANYQIESLDYVLDIEDFINKSRHFAQILKRFDVWNIRKSGDFIDEMFIELLNFANSGYMEGSEIEFKRAYAQSDVSDWDEKVWEISGVGGVYNKWDYMRYSGIKLLWRKIGNLGNMLEDIWKEAYLPTYILNDRE